jgi:hypothetical protein
MIAFLPTALVQDLHHSSTTHAIFTKEENKLHQELTFFERKLKIIKVNAAAAPERANHPEEEENSTAALSITILLFESTYSISPLLYQQQQLLCMRKKYAHAYEDKI